MPCARAAMCRSSRAAGRHNPGFGSLVGRTPPAAGCRPRSSSHTASCGCMATKAARHTAPPLASPCAPTVLAPRPPPPCPAARTTPAASRAACPSCCAPWQVRHARRPAPPTAARQGPAWQEATGPLRHVAQPSGSPFPFPFPFLPRPAAWIYDRDPFQPLKWQDDLEKFKARLAAGEDVFGEGQRWQNGGSGGRVA